MKTLFKSALSAFAVTLLFSACSSSQISTSSNVDTPSSNNADTTKTDTVSTVTDSLNIKGAAKKDSV